MEIEIIPAINVVSFEELQKRVRQVEPYVKWVHLDVADGTFTKNSIWHNPEDILKLRTPLFIELHLMITSIDERMQEWLKPNVTRAIFHVEAAKDPSAIIDICHRAGKEVGIAFLPETEPELVFPFARKADMVQVLAVTPGEAGQKFQDHTLQKILALRNYCPTCPLEVDGGVTQELAPQLIKSGATILVAATVIFGSSNIQQAIDTLRGHA